MFAQCHDVSLGLSRDSANVLLVSDVDFTSTCAQKGSILTSFGVSQIAIYAAFRLFSGGKKNKKT
jgi:hypothetical protein|tara:strand:- start:87 stop:281 length:195 start_codon:yes stop_codon:yes gene_type:complete